MSGGAFDYAFSKMRQFAEDLRVRLEEDDQGWDDPAVTRTLHEIAGLADRAAAHAHEAEWLYSGDTSEESFLRRMDALRHMASMPDQDRPRPGSQWRNPRTGAVCTVLDTCDHAAEGVALPPIVAYYDQDRRVWARDLPAWLSTMAPVEA